MGALESGISCPLASPEVPKSRFAPARNRHISLLLGGWGLRLTGIGTEKYEGDALVRGPDPGKAVKCWSVPGRSGLEADDPATPGLLQ
jgi:hypothetical protein